MIEIIIPILLVLVLGLSVAWLLQPADKGRIVSHDPTGHVQLEHELGVQLNGGHLPPDLGPPPPAAVLEQDTNRIYIDD